MDVFQIAGAWLERVKAHYADDVAIVAYYGSYARGSQKPHSDLDLFFIPAGPRGYEAASCALVEGLTFDFWPLSWERAERMAAFEEPMAGILTESKLLYARTAEDEKRFLGLRRTVEEWLSPAHRLDMLDKGLRELERCYISQSRLERPEVRRDLAAARTAASALVTGLLHSLSLAGQAVFTRGWGQNHEEVLRLPLQPAGLGEALDRLVTEPSAENIRRICGRLLEDTRVLLLAERSAYGAAKPAASCFGGLYEELKGNLDKAAAACREGDMQTVFFAVMHVREELWRHSAYAAAGLWPSALQAPGGLPVLGEAAGTSPAELLGRVPLEEVAAAVERWGGAIRRALAEQGVAFREYATAGEFCSAQQAPPQGEALLSAAKSVNRQGGVVLRPSAAWTGSVHALLRHLERSGFAMAPKVLGTGFALDGRETVSYVEGEFVHPGPWSDEGIIGVGRMLRSLHEASADFSPPEDARWQPWFLRELGGARRVFGHGDVAPWNVVTRGGLPVGLIDWEFAGPVDPLAELARVCWLFPQLHDDDVAARVGLPGLSVRARQLRLLADAYGVPAEERMALLELMIQVAVAEAAGEAVELGAGPETHGPLWGIAWRTRAAAWMLRHRDVLARALLE